jgi:hypothetical protein
MVIMVSEGVLEEKHRNALDSSYYLGPALTESDPPTRHTYTGRGRAGKRKTIEQNSLTRATM